MLVTLERNQDYEIIGFDLGFVGQSNTLIFFLTLISSFAITSCFQKVNFQGFNLVILNFELPSVFLYALCELFEKQAVLCGRNSVSVKIRDSLLCLTTVA